MIQSQRTGFIESIFEACARLDLACDLSPLQKKIDSAIQSDHNNTFLRILSQYRLLGMTNMELQIQMAIRDQVRRH